MNHLVILSTILVLTSCGQSPESDLVETELESETIEAHIPLECSDFAFESVRAQSDSLLVFMERAIRSDPPDQLKWEQQFFCAFPNSFERMKMVFGYDNEYKDSNLYSHDVGWPVINHFIRLENIPDSIYYDKYVRINIDGVWEADHISGAFQFAHWLAADTKNACDALMKFSDHEIRSVFRFIFDGPHPKNEFNERTYTTLKPLLDNRNERLGRLLTQAYDTLIAEDDEHGH